MNEYEVLPSVTNRAHCVDCRKVIPINTPKIKKNRQMRSRVYYYTYCKECGQKRIQEDIDKLKSLIELSEKAKDLPIIQVPVSMWSPENNGSWKIKSKKCYQVGNSVPFVADF